MRTLAPLSSHLGIGVVAVAPGVIKTPLWTDNPEKMRLVEEGRDAWVEPEEVAECMVELVGAEEVEVSNAPNAVSREGSDRVSAVEGPLGRGPPGGKGGFGVVGDSYGEGTRMVKVEGGMVIEVAKGRRRVVRQFMDPGPSGEGNTVSGMGIAEREIWASLREGWGC